MGKRKTPNKMFNIISFLVNVFDSPLAIPQLLNSLTPLSFIK